MSLSEKIVLFPFAVPPQNQMAANMLNAALKDSAARTLPTTVPGPSVDENGVPLPENDPRRKPQMFSSGIPIVVDDEVAKVLLLSNTMNRKTSPNNIENLARSIFNGRWRFNGVSSALPCTNTSIMDKQHTFYAVIDAFAEGRARGVLVKPIVMVPIIGLDPETFASIDGGKSRSTTDTLTASEKSGTLSLEDVPPEALGTALRVAAQYLNRTEVLPDDHPLYLYNDRARIANDRVVEFVRSMPDLSASLQYCVDINVPVRKSIFGIAVLGVLHMLISKVQSETAANNFIKALEFGAKLEEDSPAHRLREQLIRDRSNKRRMEGIELLAACCRTWNYVACHKNMPTGKRIRTFNSDGSFPAPIPMQRRGSALTR